MSITSIVPDPGMAIVRTIFEAIQAMQTAVALSERSAETLAGLPQAYAAAERQDDPREALRELEQQSRGRYVSANSMAKIPTVTDSDHAFEWRTKSCDEGSADLIELAVEPAFARIRSDSRFRDLLRRIDLVPNAGMPGWRFAAFLDYDVPTV